MFAVVILVNAAFVALIIWSLRDPPGNEGGRADGPHARHRNPGGGSRGEDRKDPASRYNLPPSH